MPFRHADWTPHPGEIKRSPTDFVVEEIPLYEPADRGTHVFFFVEKTGLSTGRAIEQIARALNISHRKIARAGLKDARAVTRQVLSVEHVELERIERLSLPQVSVLWARRHTNKVRLGHLRANRFTIRLREVAIGSADSFRDRLKVLAETGVPNYFGPQRFGSRGHTALLGRALVLEDWSEMFGLLAGRPGEFDTGAVLEARKLLELGEFERAARTWPFSHRDEKDAVSTMARTGDERKACMAVRPRSRQFYIDALQSSLFNRVVARRVGAMGSVLRGDLAWLHRNGACFAVEYPEVEQPRCDAGEISPTGPLFGRKMSRPTGEAAEIEREVLEEEGLSPDHFEGKSAGSGRGARRPLRFLPTETGVDGGSDAAGPFVELTFALPPGCYATSLLRELCHAAPMEGVGGG